MPASAVRTCASAMMMWRPCSTPPERPLADGAEVPPGENSSGEKYTSLIRLPPMSRAMWEMQSASCCGSEMLGASRRFFWAA